MPLSLLFSSDEEMSHRVVQALQELELDTQPCPDVFTAVEWLINRRFDLIVADCDSGPEAGFLLNNARELKLNKTAFSVALTSGSASLTPEEAGADLILTKPLTTDEIKYALLSNDRFLSCMKVWVAPVDTSQPLEEIPSESAQVNLDLPSPPSLAVRPDPPSPMRSGRLEKSTPSTVRPSRPEAARNRGKILGGIVLGAVFFCVGFLSRQPARVHDAFAKISAVYKQAWQMTFKQAVEEAEYEASPSPPKLVDLPSESPKGARRRAAKVRVNPIQPLLVPPVEAQTEADLNQNQLPTTDSRITIPESLRDPPSENAPLPTTIAKRPVSLLGQLEPVALSEDLARELLLDKVQPNYPEQALKAGLQGVVVLQAWIGRDGSVQDLKLVNGSLLLGRAAVSAVKQWRYKPYLRNGVAVEAETYVTVDFKLP
jgi:TonB family protein